MARTKKATQGGEARGPVDVQKLHERARRLKTNVRKTVQIGAKIDARMYESLIEAAERFQVDLSEVVRRAIAQGLPGIAAFSADDEWKPPGYLPGRGFSRPPSTLEIAVGATPAEDEAGTTGPVDPLMARFIPGGMRRNMAMRRPATAIEAEPEAEDEVVVADDEIEVA